MVRPTGEQAQNAAANGATENAGLIKELLVAGVPLRRVAELFDGRVGERELNAIAREAVTESPAPDADLGLTVLQRSSTATQDPNFVCKYLTSLTSDAPEELLDPLYSTLMKDPVVISSGYVLDRNTVLNERGQLRFSSCPFTRASLKNDVYPLVEKRRKLQEFKEKRIDAMAITAQTFLADRNFDQFDQVIHAAECFLDDLGEDTYIHRSRRLAELRLEAAELPGRAMAPAELAKSYIRIHRTLESLQAPQFQRQVVKLVAAAHKALAEDRLADAGQWCDACEAVRQACQLTLPVERLRLELAKKRGEDLKVPRQLVFRAIREDPGVLQRFLEEEGVVLDDLRDLRPLLLLRLRIDERTENDEWHRALQSPPLEGAVVKVRVAADQFIDQGWGNTKGNLGLALYDGQGALAARCNLFGTYRTDSYRFVDSTTRMLEEGEEVVAKAEPGFTYSLEYTVGGGGGHSLHVRHWTCKIFYRGWANESFVSYRMADPEGDEGLYTGPADGNGKAHGNGELDYDDGECFVGEFAHGSMVDGALYRGANVKDTMKSQSWTDDVDSSVADRFPFQVVVCENGDARNGVTNAMGEGRTGSDSDPDDEMGEGRTGSDSDPDDEY